MANRPGAVAWATAEMSSGSYFRALLPLRSCSAAGPTGEYDPT